MRTFLACAATVGLTTGLLLTGPASGVVRHSDGPATVTLEDCGVEQSSTHVEGCSYIYMRSKGAPLFTYVTAPGPVSWQGALAGDSLTFPPLTWPTLTKLYLSTATISTGPVAGVIDSAGRVQMTFSYSLLINALGDLCTITGRADLSSDRAEWLSGAGAGSSYDPQTGRFAVASTGYSPVTATGTCVRVTEYAYDLSAGMAWYLTGTLTIPPGVEPPVLPTPTPMAAAWLKVTARPAGKAIPRTGHALLVRNVMVGSGQRARITVKAPKKVRVLKTATTVEVRTEHAPKRVVRVRITASGPGVTDTTWARRWRLR